MSRKRDIQRTARKVGIFMPGKLDRSFIKAVNFLVSIIKPHQKWYFFASSIALISVGTGLLNTKITQVLIDTSINGTLNNIIRSATLFLVVIAINIVLSYFSAISVAKLSAYSSRDMKHRIAYRLIHAEYSKIIKQTTGDALSTINSDTKTVSDFLGSDLIGLFSQAVMLLGAMIYIISISPSLALITFAYTPIGMLLAT